MKRFSLKLKLTAMYSFFMVLVTCLCLAVLFSLSGNEILTSAQMHLRERVQESADEIELEDGEFEIDSDFYSLDNNVYLALYDTGGNFLYGKVPPGLEQDPQFEDGKIQMVKSGTEQWYVYDVQYEMENGQEFYIRGVVSVTETQKEFLIAVRFAVILLPLTVILTALIGYRLIRRTLLPVRQMTETVQEIQKDGDLSRRIGVSQETGKDEFYQLAGTFDGMLESLEQAFLRERQFTSDVSHELRTPVSVILAQCEASLNRTDLSEEQRKEILLIRKKAGEMSQMISQLLLLSRADQGRQQLNKEEINISELTQIIVEEQKMLAQRRKIEVHTEIEPDITGYLDESFYIRMLDNLISNAVSYGKEGGNIKVTLHQIPSGVRGTVEDDGIGISRDDQVHIWERFYRVDASRTGKEDGSHSGLGLSMVKWIAQAHGGNVRVESELGKGSCFTFELKF
ncbi:sensor histidine kinase [Mediterraneibacter gnavus]|uniref:sensor histidine kinase n=1 Tax=Mediterraneibacter gnavus TaxID=33038 RepID=UPI00232C1D95|nr:ATP-binding protein [Mediterraneibacter gnavus]MDB8711016.1 ATP-binding protein [Mediterraneibacter gnavus]MDB8714292.1 ATP-binding protein [Mediterraneibacter gnavus]